MTENYPYKVFISYSSADRAWASKLSNALEGRDIEPYLDEKRLTAGARWDKELLEGLEASRHIVVLWSQMAADSDWVQQEITRFDIQIQETTSDRRMIFLLLDREANKFFGSFQAITDLRDAGAYAEPADRVDSDLWQLVQDKVHDAITSDNPPIPVPLAVLTMTREQVNNLKLGETPPLAEEPLGTFLKRIGIGSKKNLKQYYGSQRTEWCPFGKQSSMKIEKMLEHLRDEINEKFRKDAKAEGLEGVRFRWEPIGEGFWGNRDAFMKEVDKLRTGMLSVVVVDPIALYDREVRDRLTLLSDNLKRAKVLFMTPLPWQCWETHNGVREHIKLMAGSVFSSWYEPAFPKSDEQADWSRDANIGDKAEIRRALLTALGHHLIDQPVKQQVHQVLRV